MTALTVDNRKENGTGYMFSSFRVPIQGCAVGGLILRFRRSRATNMEFHGRNKLCRGIIM